MPPIVSHRNTEVRVYLGPLVEGRLEETELTADVAASAGSITVKDINGFSTTDYIVIGELGREGTELSKVDAVTAPSGTTITLDVNTEFAHSAGTKVYKVAFNQIEISHAATLTGSKSVLATQDLQVDGKVHRYLDVSQTSGFYFARFYEATDDVYGSYSDGVPYGGWAATQVGFMFDRALHENSTDFSDILTLDDLYEWTNECLDLIQGKQLRWAEHQELNKIVDQAQRGDRTVTMPTDIYDDDTNKSIMGVRIGDEQNLTFLDPDEFEQHLEDTKETEVRTQATSGNTSLAVENSFDFADSGTLHVYVSGTKYDITYTGVTRDDTDGATAAFTGIPASGDGSISVTIPVGTKVWQDEQEGEPEVYTVRNGAIEFHPMVDAAHDNANVYMDYFTVATKVDSQGDTIDQQRHRLLQNYLNWRVKMKVKNDNVLDERDGFFTQFKEQLNDAIRTKRSVFDHKMMPQLNRIRYRGTYPNFRRNNANDG